MIQFDRVKLALANATGDIKSDSYLASITIHHATGIAVEPSEGAADRFHPVLYGNMRGSPPSEENEEVQVVRQPRLPTEHALKFKSVLFPRQGARSHYRLTDGVYAVVDEPVEAAIRVIERVNASDEETRAAFRANPRSFLNEEIEKAGGAGDILCESTILREAMDYGERVLGVQEWNGVHLSFKIPVYYKWFPDDEGNVETYTLDIPGSQQPLFVRPDQVSKLRDTIDNALAGGRKDISFDGKTFPLSSELVDTVNKLVGHVSPQITAAKPKKAENTSGKLLVLRAAANEEDLIFNASLRDPSGTLAQSLVDAPLKTSPMPHQKDGISWLRHTFISGMPGVLLADDMGLGKTFQVLAFLYWLRSRTAATKKPILVVAPKKLLEVWLEEISGHLGSDGLGIPVLAYDENLRYLKISSGKDGQLGCHTLDVERLRSADWVLTTYETLRDYHFSFAKVRFCVAVYDEAQKMKSMASLINNAAKCQQPEFTVLMTGTPIENSVMDLWTLLDVSWPGFLELSGKEFAKTYGDGATPEQLNELKRRLIEPVRIGDRQCPPVMLRRFKSEILVGLPKKEEHEWREDMPPEQARAYDAVVAEQKAKQVHPLQALQTLRAVAFHPNLKMPTGPGDHAGLINSSARFRALFRILDKVSSTAERALVFVDLRMGQRVLAELIRSRYRLRKHPQIINGDTSTKSLREIKAEFQSGRGFEVLLLGPRAAGFGLTLTAANHVIHLNRWWNPAVEDQCSDRVYRVGQDKEVTIHIPIAVHPSLGEQSFDVLLNSMLGSKRSLSREIVVPTTMTDTDFRELFDAVVSGDGSIGIDGIDRMGWREFEDWAASQFSRAGFQPHRTPRSHDGGADLIVRPPSGKIARPIICQCKHRSLGEGMVDEKAIQDVLRGSQSLRPLLFMDL